MPSDLTGGGAVHEVVAAVLAVTPLDCAGQAYTGDDEYDMPIFDDPTPIAARQAAAVLRWAADRIRDEGGDTCGCGCNCASRMETDADEIDPKESRDDRR